MSRMFRWVLPALAVYALVGLAVVWPAVHANASGTGGAAYPAQIPTATPTSTATPTNTPTNTPAPPTATFTATPTKTPTPTNTPFRFTGFFQPVATPPAVNQMKAGRAVPIKFSLGSNLGLNILAPGYPQSQQIACPSSATIAPAEETATSGKSALTYDSSKKQ